MQHPPGPTPPRAVLLLHPPGPRSCKPVLSTSRWIGRLRSAGTPPPASRPCGSGSNGPAMRGRPSNCKVDAIRPSVWPSARRNTARSVRAVVIARAEYFGCPPRPVRASARQPATAASENHTVRLPRARRPALYSAELVTQWCCRGMWCRRSALALNGKVVRPRQPRAGPPCQTNRQPRAWATRATTSVPCRGRPRRRVQARLCSAKASDRCESGVSRRSAAGLRQADRTLETRSGAPSDRAGHALCAATPADP
jgi:hypothetical protein